MIAFCLFLSCEESKTEDKLKRENTNSMFVSKIANSLMSDKFKKWEIFQRTSSGLIMNFYFDNCLYRTFVMIPIDKNQCKIKPLNKGNSTFTIINSSSILDQSIYFVSASEFINAYKIYSELKIDLIEWDCEREIEYFEKNGLRLAYLSNPNFDESYLLNINYKKLKKNWFYHLSR